MDMVLRILESLPLSRMVEVGCGAGEFIAELAELKPRVHLVGVDVDGKAIGEAYATACALRPASRMGFACGDCAALPLAACSADVVVFRGLLHHVEEFALALAEARRVLDEGGLLLIQDARRVPAPLFEEMNEALRQSGCPRDVHPGFDPEDLARQLGALGLLVEDVIEGGTAILATPPWTERVYSTGLFLLSARRT